MSLTHFNSMLGLAMLMFCVGLGIGYIAGVRSNPTTVHTLRADLTPKPCTEVYLRTSPVSDINRCLKEKVW